MSRRVSGLAGVLVGRFGLCCWTKSSKREALPDAEADIEEECASSSDRIGAASWLVVVESSCVDVSSIKLCIGGA